MKLLRELFQPTELERYQFAPYSLCVYKEKESWRRVEPSGSGWNVKKYRPLIVLKESTGYYYFILMTTSYIRCKKGASAMFSKKDLLISLSGCELVSNRCRWLNEETRLFRKRTRKKECHIVLRMRKRYFVSCIHKCGTCGANVIPERVIDIIERELELWKRKDSGLS